MHNPVYVLNATELDTENGTNGKIHVIYVLPVFKSLTFKYHFFKVLENFSIFPDCKVVLFKTYCDFRF